MDTSAPERKKALRIAAAITACGLFFGIAVGLRFYGTARPLQGTGEIVWKQDNSIMVGIPAGTFRLGNKWFDNTRAENLDYYIDKHEVTNTAFASFLNSIPPEKLPAYIKTVETAFSSSTVKGRPVFAAAAGQEDYPALGVTWYGADAYCQWAGKRLPTEREWERACYAGARPPVSFGSSASAPDIDWAGQSMPEEQCFPRRFCDRPRPVSAGVPNGAGIFGMSGGAMEWTADGFHLRIDKFPPSPDSADMTLRGGSFMSDRRSRRCSTRYPALPDAAARDTGFRCAADRPRFG